MNRLISKENSLIEKKSQPLLVGIGVSLQGFKPRVF